MAVRGKGIKARTQDAILKERGLKRSTDGGLRPVFTPSKGQDKTLAMKLLEIQHGKDIEELIREGTIADVAEYLGIEESTISKWRLRLGLRTRADRE